MNDIRTGRRLARITVDVLLPSSYSDVDLSECEVRSVTIQGDDEHLYDVIQATVVPATLIPVEPDE